MPGVARDRHRRGLPARRRQGRGARRRRRQPARAERQHPRQRQGALPRPRRRGRRGDDTACRRRGRSSSSRSSTKCSRRSSMCAMRCAKTRRSSTSTCVTKSMAGAASATSRATSPRTSSSKRGDVEAGFAEADDVVEREFTTKMVHQGYIEPHNATAIWNADGTVTVWTSTQGAFVGAHTARRDSAHAGRPDPRHPDGDRRRLRRQAADLPRAGGGAALEEDRPPGEGDR